MKLRQRMLAVFACTMAIGLVILYFVSRGVLSSSFRQLENDQMRQDVGNAIAAVDAEYLDLGKTTNDYAYWDRTYNFMAAPQNDDIGKEFQDAEMEGLSLNLILLMDTRGQVAFAKAYDQRRHQAVEVPLEFLQKLLSRPQMAPQAVARAPRDGLVGFPDSVYIISTRPILSSQRTGTPRGLLMTARKFDDNDISRVTDLTRTSILFQRIASASLPPDFRRAVDLIRGGQNEIAVTPLSEDQVAGYAMLPDVFGDPLVMLRVDTRRFIYERGRFSQIYLFVVVFTGAVLASLVIILFLQKFVLSRLARLENDISDIGERKAIQERVRVSGRDELSRLGDSINGMLGELEKSQKHFLLITDNIHQVFWIRNVRTGEYEYISKAYETIWERPRAALLHDAQSWKQMLHPDDREAVEHMLEEQARGESSEARYRIVRADGADRWLWERTFVIRDPDGTARQITGLTEDITDFKRTEQALRNAQVDLENRVDQRTAELAERGELVKLLVDSTSGAMYGMDGEGICTFCNPAAVKMLGYENASEILGQPVHPLIHHTRKDGSPFPMEECPIFRGFRDGVDAHVIEDIFWRKDRTSFPVEYSSRQIRRNGRLVGAVVNFLDITERKRQEMEVHQGQKLEAVGRLAAGIAHEINTPIQFIGDNTRFLRNSFLEEVKLMRRYEALGEAAAKGPVEPALLSEVAATRAEVDWPYLEEEIPRALEQMLDGLGRVSSIVRGMKEFSHVDRSIEKAPGDINRAIESTLIVGRNELKYVADVETHLGPLPTVVCHLGDLNQVFLNLLINAAHAIEEAGKGSNARGKIGVSTRQDGDWVEIAISDTGTGIPEEARGKIFDPFFTTKGVGKGTGQGLALARAVVVDKHGGTIHFVTEMGKGTTFFIRLPLTPAATREEALVR